jgi:hypothetical protein
VIAFWLWVRSFPSWVWLGLAAVALAGGLYVKGRSDGKEACQRAQEAAEAKADAKAAKVAAESTKRAEEITARVTKETDDARERIREVVRYLPRTCPALPSSVRDDLQRGVEAARRGLPQAADDAD